MKGLLTSLITVLTFTGLQAQSLPSAPKLVVGLTIDQLRTDYLEAFSSLYGEKGFKRLWKEGRVFHNAEYTFCGVDRASAIAAIYSGTTPSMNGIISQRWMDASTLRPVNSTDDTAFMGYYTDQTAAPTKLLTSTIADELKIATQGKGLVYAIAPDCDAALFAAGHAGNGAFWLNPNTGKWSGTTYYGEFPWWASQYNDRQAIDFRIAGMTWEPVFPRGMYTFLPDWRDILFKYKFDDDRNNKYRRFIASPFVNDEVNALAEEALNKSSIGMDDITDLLALTYYAGNYAHKSVQECAMEIQDTYVRLAFLALFSQHPAVSSNFLLLVFHPGQLLFLPYIVYCVRKGKKCWYLTLNLVVLTLFIVLFPVIPQRFDFAVVPLALVLLIRSASNLIVTSKKK